MHWLHPIWLWGLTALSVPILVHLFSFRRARKVAFSQTAFLQEVRRETKSRSRLRHLLILLMRLLAMAALILAFAEPVFEADRGTGGHKMVSIYIDNSPSMQGEGRNGGLLETAKIQATSIVDWYEATDRFHVLTTGFLAEDQRMLSQKEALERIALVVPAHAAQPIEAVMMRQMERLQQAGESTPNAFVFSDLQKSSHGNIPRAQAPGDSSLALRFVAQMPVFKPNVRIDSAWFEAPMRLAGRSERLHVRIAHDASRPLQGLPLSLHIDGERVAIGGFDLQPGRATDTVLTYSHPGLGLQHGIIRLDDAPVVFDDAFYMGYEVVEQIKTALVIGDAATVYEEVALGRIFSDEQQFALDIQSEGAARFAEIERADLVVIAGVRNPSSGWIEVLVNLIEGGGSVLFIPPAGELGTGWGQLMARLGTSGFGPWTALEEPVRLGEIHDKHPHFLGVFNNLSERIDLPNVRGWHSRPGQSLRGDRPLLSFPGGDAFITAGAFGSGKFYALSSPLQSEWNNLAHHALWVPTLLRMAENARQTPLISATAGRESRILIGGAQMRTDAPWTIEPGGLRPAVQNVPGGIAIEIESGSLSPGNYEIVQLDPSGLGSERYALGVNPDPRESELASWEVDEFSKKLKAAGWSRGEVLSGEVESVVRAVGASEGQRPLWMYLIAAGLAFLAIEMLLLKLGRSKPVATLQPS